MPELPEVETMVRGIRDQITGCVLTAYHRAPCTRQPLSVLPEPQQVLAEIAGERCLQVDRFAKRVLLGFESGATIAIEPRMTGLMLLSDPPTLEHLRVEWQFRRKASHPAFSLWFWDRRGLGTVRFYTAGQFEQEITSRYGPDALTMTPALWRERLSRTPRAVKIAMLDQSLVAGIGNLYASEILHGARILPDRPALSLTAREVTRLATYTRQILETAIRYEGSTLADGTYRNALNKAGGYQNEHRVYGRAGLDCPTCGTKITRIVQAQRSSFFCGRCQK